MRRAAPAQGATATARDTFRQLLVLSWHAFHPRPALYPLPAIVGVLGVGLAMGEPGGAIVAASGAFSAGFGAFQQLSRRVRVAPILAATLVMAMAGGVGTVAANSALADAALVAAAAFLLGLGAGLGTGPWWVLLQGAIYLVISGSIPGDLREGLNRAALILLGGLVQAVSISALRAMLPAGFPPLVSPTSTRAPSSPRQWAVALRRVVDPRSPEIRHGLLLGLAAGAGLLIGRGLALANGYWVAMTVLLVLRRGAGETFTRGALRIAGTLVGAGVVTLIVALLRPASVTLALLLVVSAWGAYALQWVNYGAFSASVTSYIAFLFALEGLPEAAVAGHRIMATLIGGALGMAAFVAARLWRLAIRPFLD